MIVLVITVVLYYVNFKFNKKIGYLPDIPEDYYLFEVGDEPNATIKFSCGDFGLLVFKDKDTSDYIEIKEWVWLRPSQLSIRRKLLKISSEGGNLYANDEVEIWNNDKQWKLIKGHICAPMEVEKQNNDENKDVI
jgi:hypothetical protein